ncbi:MAG: PspA/IM30 family protein [Hahellaceae bacterium]|nr:PspA/IM30 family protein [Hahellaceae bacterium]
MSIMRKMSTAFRGVWREQGEQWLDRHALVIFEQEIVEVEQLAQGSRQRLVALMAERKQIERQQHTVCQRIKALEDDARLVLTHFPSGAVEALAEKIVEAETQKRELQAMLDQMSTDEANARQSLRSLLDTIRQHRFRLSLAKSKANALACAGSEPRNVDPLADLRSSWTRIEGQQARLQDELDASRQVDDVIEGEAVVAIRQDLAAHQRRQAISQVLERLTLSASGERGPATEADA